MNSFYMEMWNKCVARTGNGKVQINITKTQS